jgi:serpin B
MLKRILSLLLVIVLGSSLFVACKPSSPEEPMGAQPTVGQTDPTIEPTTPDVIEPSVPVGPDKPTGEYDALSAEDMAAYIVDRAYEYNKGNTMYSPLSFNMAVALVAEGASPEYDNLFAALLDKEDYVQYVQEYDEHLKKLNVDKTDVPYSSYKTMFNIANSLWVDQKCDLMESYLESAKPFNAKVEAVDFSNKTATVNKINQWCAEKTLDMIKEALAPNDIDKDTTMVAVNAVYFESPWAETWDVLKQNETFKDFSGNKIEHASMTSLLSKYYENDRATAFGCDYKNGLTFIGILPKDEGEFALQDLDLASLIDSETNEYDVRAKMPKFKFNNRIDNLSEILTNLGYGKLFDKEDGIFTKILTRDGVVSHLTIAKIIQADAIELDENGTKAAAVTALATDCTSSIQLPKEVKKVDLTRPFAFVIYDNEMDQIVFVGKVVTLVEY